MQHAGNRSIQIKGRDQSKTSDNNDRYVPFFAEQERRRR